jgi:N-acetylglucosamine-6-phosphate deacetylase
MRVESPGFFDLQVNGFAGVDFNSPATSGEQVTRALAAMRATGVTRLLPTLITSSLEQFSSCAKTLLALHDPAIAGIHMEGPYISPADGPRGTHLRAYVRTASMDDFRRRQEAAEGRVVLVTLAPEVEGALRLTEQLAASGIRVAIGHTGASPEQVHNCVKAGASLSTHLGNGCANLLPRHPNFLWEQLAADELSAGFIVDGHHLSPATVKAMIRAKTPGRSFLVTDATAAAGCQPGRYVLGDVAVELSPEGRVSEVGAPWLAGSALQMNNAVANTVKFTGLPLEEALCMASTRPAKLMGMETSGRVAGDWEPQAGSLQIVSVA